MPRLRRLDASVSEPEGVALLYGVPLFQPLRRPLVEQLASRLEQVHVRAGDVVVREGDVGDLFYVIESGALDASHDGRLLSHMTTGDHFGEIALLRDVPRTASVVAAEDSVLQTIQREDFLAALTGDEELRGRTESVAARRLANT
jgi:CRP-like cAMP-binding protein